MGIKKGIWPVKILLEQYPTVEFLGRPEGDPFMEIYITQIESFVIAATCHMGW